MAFPQTPPPPPTARRAARRGHPGHGTDPAHNIRGAAIMVASMVAFVVNDAAIKAVSETLPLYEGVALRGAVVSLILFVLVWRSSGGLDFHIGPGDRLPFALRLVAEVASTILYLKALQHMPLGALSAIHQSLPLLVMLAAALVFGERLGWHRLAAVAVGVAGVALIVRPGTAGFEHWSPVALASVLVIVVRDIATRGLSSRVRSGTVALSAALSVTIAAVLLPGGEPWRMPTGGELGGLAIASVFLAVGYLTAVAAMRVGEVSFVSPFRYTSLVAAMIVGFLVFGEVPRLTTLAGAVLIVAAGAYSLLRERRALRGG